MTKLTEVQTELLTIACARPGRLVLPLPDRLKGGAATKVVGSLIAKGLVEEVDAGQGDPVWRDTGDGHGVTLVATDLAVSALGIAPAADPAGEDAPPVTGDDHADQNDGASVDSEPTVETAPRTRADSKQARLIGMLKRPEGASVAEIVTAFGWQPHTVRGAIAGALKKKLGLNVTSEKEEERGRVYRISD
ncbi:hypothetical protein BAL199_28875 [alpha proteobacterium BAL199]|jgi:hypothetical protein|nr:hypothetical protein BAL199_28875 [alpha proteobacterium BAL199]